MLSFNQSARNLRRRPQLIIVDHYPELLAAEETRFQVTLNYNVEGQVTQVGANEEFH